MKEYRHPLSAIWHSMKQRCDYPKSKSFKNYGGRGISYDPDWKLLKNFCGDMGERPSLNHTLDRIDNNKDYSKSNCRWVTKQDQLRNKRNNIRINGILLIDVADQAGIPRSTLYTRHYSRLRGLGGVTIGGRV